MPIWTDQLQLEPIQFVGTSLTAFVGPQLYNCGMLPTTNTLVPEVLFVVIWNVTGTSAGPGNARVAASSNAVQTTHSALGVRTIRMIRIGFSRASLAKGPKPLRTCQGHTRSGEPE